MNNIDLITHENFDEMFDLSTILHNSVFYPASGIDGRAIETLSLKFNSFINVDYSTTKEVVETAMRNEFGYVGFELIGFKEVTISEVIPQHRVSGYGRYSAGRNMPDLRTLIWHGYSAFEKERLKMEYYRDRLICKDFAPFAFWAVYELNPSRTGKTEGKAKRFSLFHIGGEACATFRALYIKHKVNPSALVIINPGLFMGDNWTDFTDNDSCLYKMFNYNVTRNGASMPQFILTNKSVWVGYTYVKSKEYYNWNGPNIQIHLYANSENV